MPGRNVVQWDKEDCADMGLIKVDLLGLGMMAVLKDCVELIPKHYGKQVDIAQIPHDDPRSSSRCGGPTPSASSRWRAGRRWHRCRATIPTSSTTWSCRSPSSGPARSSAR